jgi:ATP-dependent RNA helicase DeaD
LVQVGDPARTIARLLARTELPGFAEARDVRVVTAPRARDERGPRGRDARGERRVDRYEARAPRAREAAAPVRPRHGEPAPRELEAAGAARELGSAPPAPRERAHGSRRSWVSFRVSWGGQHGADARRLLAMVCRRGEIRGSDVGAIRVERTFSIVDVAQDVAAGFEQAAAEPDPREPRVVIRRDGHVDADGSGQRRPARPAAGGFPKRGPGSRPFPKRRR